MFVPEAQGLSRSQRLLEESLNISEEGQIEDKKNYVRLIPPSLQLLLV